MVSKRVLHAIEAARSTVRRARQRADEALSAAPAAFITRRGAKRLVQAKLVSPGAPDASRTVGRITEPEVPINAFRNDVSRKKSLAQVMPARTGIIDDLLGDDDCPDDQKDAEGRCPDDPDFDPDTVGQYETTEESYDLGMAVADGPRSKAPEDLSGPALGRYLDEERKTLPADDRKVNLRFNTASPPVPGARCGSCIYFDPEGSSCAVVHNLVTAQLVCDLWTPRKRGEGAAIQTFADEMQK